VAVSAAAVGLGFDATAAASAMGICCMGMAGIDGIKFVAVAVMVGIDATTAASAMGIGSMGMAEIDGIKAVALLIPQLPMEFEA
jgi:hypothetical protein